MWEYPTYEGMLEFKTYSERLNYLRLWDKPHQAPRSISNHFYKSPQWKACREDIIRRDAGSDLGIIGNDIEKGDLIVHHINPLTPDDIENWSDKLFDPNNLITVSKSTHNSIHYKPKVDDYVERRPGDTKLW